MRFLCLTVLVFIVGAFGEEGSSSFLCAADKDSRLTEELLFNSERLVRIEITITELDWDTLRSQSRSLAAALSKDDLAESPYTWFRGDISIDGVKMSSVGIRKKGFLGSQDEVRPSLKVKFSKFKNNSRIGGLDRLTLNNNKQDSTLAYQFLGYRLYRDAGLPAPRCGLAEVLVNGRSLGVYSNVESIKKPFLANEFGDDSGNLYEGTYPADFYPDRIHRFEAKTNEKKNDRTKLREIARLLDGSGDDLAGEIAAHVDMEQLHKFWALESLIGFWDGYCANQNNYFVYVNPIDSRIHFIPWGLDSAFSESIITPFNPGPASVKAKGLLAFQLYQDPQIRARHVESVRRLLDTIWKEQELIAGIDHVTEMTKSHRHEAQGEVKKSTDKMKAFVSGRRRQILNEIKDGPVDYKTPPPPPMYSRKVGEVAGTFSTVWADKPDEDRLEQGSAELTLKVDGKDITFSQIGVIAEPRPPTPGRPPRSGLPPPTLTFTGMRESTGKTISLWIGFAEPQFQSSNGDGIAVQGLLMEGQNFFTMRFFAGTAVLNDAARKEGAAVSGRLKGGLFQLKIPR